jgi:hypothetical protein
MAANNEAGDSDTTVGYSIASDLALTSDEDETTPQPTPAEQSAASVSTTFQFYFNYLAFTNYLFALYRP